MRKITQFCRRHAVAVSFCLIALGVTLAMMFDRWLEGLGTFLAAGASPSFASTPFSNATPGALTAANTATDGTGTSLLLVTAPAVAGGGAYVESVRVMHKGTNVQTVVRIFLNNGSTPTVAGNNSLVAERQMNANTLSQTTEQSAGQFTINQPLKGHPTTPERIYVTIGTAVSAGLQFTPAGGDL